MVFAEVLDAAASKRKVNVDDIPDLLRAYNDRRHDDAIAVCKLSEEGMGGARSVRPAFAAQLLVTVLLNQTLGRLAPKVRCARTPDVRFRWQSFFLRAPGLHQCHF